MSRIEKARTERADGVVTRDRILEAAGHLFAEFGYEAVTSKAICEASNVNQAAINYHFGGRQPLYEILLTQVHETLMNVEHLDELLAAPLTSEEKVAQFLDKLVPRLLDTQSWRLRLWAREMASPSSTFKHVMDQEVEPKIKLFKHLLSDLTGLPEESPDLLRCVLSVMSPCLVLLICNRDPAMPFHSLFDDRPEIMASHMKRFILAGLKAISSEEKVGTPSSLE